MPSELRHILFRPAEVAVAITEYYRRTGTPLPQGSIVRCGPECESAGSAMRFRMVLVLDIADSEASMPSAGAHREVVVEGPILAAALILYCRDRRIPMPVSGDKSLQRFGEQVGLVVTINPRQGNLPAVERLG